MYKLKHSCNSIWYLILLKKKVTIETFPKIWTLEIELALTKEFHLMSLFELQKLFFTQTNLFRSHLRKTITIITIIWSKAKPVLSRHFLSGALLYLDLQVTGLYPACLDGNLHKQHPLDTVHSTQWCWQCRHFQVVLICQHRVRNSFFSKCFKTASCPSLWPSWCTCSVSGCWKPWYTGGSWVSQLPCS